MTLEKPFGGKGSLKVVNDRELKPTFGTGIHSVTPAHNIEDLRMAQPYDLNIEGCIDPETGFLSSPGVLAGTDIADEDKTIKAIKAALTEEN